MPLELFKLTAPRTDLTSLPALKKESPPPTPEDLPDELKNKSVRELNLLALSTMSTSFGSDEDEEEAEECNDHQPQGMESHRL